MAPDICCQRDDPSQILNTVVKGMSYVGGSCGGYGIGAAAFALVLFILLVIVLRAGFFY